MTDLQIPDNFSYTAEHEWINAGADTVAGTVVRVGITMVAADQLGDIVYIGTPGVGDSVTAGQVCGEVESTKSVADIFSPVTGQVTAINDAAISDPSVVNSDPYGKGWLFEVQASAAQALLDAQQYRALVQE